MKRAATALLCAVLALALLPGCGAVSKAVSALKKAALGPEPTGNTVNWSARAETSPPGEQETLPKRTIPSQTSLPKVSYEPRSGNGGVSQPEMTEYFRQVVFGDGESAVAVKWTNPILVLVSGRYDQEDCDTLASVFNTLNGYEGFPGAAFAQGPQDVGVNLQIKYVTAQELRQAEPDWTGKSPCYAAYWNNTLNEIYKAVVYVVPSMEATRADQDCDVSWGVFFTLGFVNNSGMYTDSVLNPGYYGDALGESYQGPCAADWRLVSLLYNPAMKPGMTFKQAIAALAP